MTTTQTCRRTQRANRASTPRQSAPLAVLAALGALDVLDTAQVHAAASCTIAVGSCPEIDLRALSWHDAALARTVADYWSATRALFAGNGRSSWVGLRRIVHVAAQSDNGAGRKDLHGELAALEQLPGLGPVLELALAAECDVDALTAETSRIRGDVTVSDDGSVTVTVPVDGVRYWDTSLGGPGMPTEVRRTVTFTARHARWRDRRVRRLTRVVVHADEIWPAA